MWIPCFIDNGGVEELEDDAEVGGTATLSSIDALDPETAAHFPMGSVLAYNGSYKRVRLMTAADVASLFAGIAWEDIYPAGWAG